MRTTASIFIILGLAALQPPAALSQVVQPATGFAISVRIPNASLQEFFSTALGSPRFALGYRGKGWTWGMGLGLAELRASDKDSYGNWESKDSFRATLVQIEPSATADIWRSADSRTRGNLVVGLGVGRLSAVDKNTYRDFDGQLQTNESKSSGTLLGVRIGIGGEHFFDPHFAVGAEGGAQVSYALSVKGEGSTSSAGAAANGTYGALRITVVF